MSHHLQIFGTMIYKKIKKTTNGSENEIAPRCFHNDIASDKDKIINKS